jgi:hypothetical protein
MIRSKLGLRALGLCALILGLMACVTSAAQAETGATWSLKNAGGTLVLIPGATDLLPEINAKPDTATVGLLFVTAGGTHTEFVCKKFELIGIGGARPKLIASGSISEGQAKFSECETRLNGAKSIPCEPHTGANKGEIITKKATGLIKLHLLAGSVVDDVVTLTPTTKNGKGEFSAGIVELGEECSIGTSVEVTGTLTVVDCQGDPREELVMHLIEEFNQLRGLKALGQTAKVNGSAFAFLVGAHEGLKFAGLPAPTKP